VWRPAGRKLIVEMMLKFFAWRFAGLVGEPEGAIF
jgi:hypothetical protein